LFKEFLRETAREYRAEFPPQFFDMIYRIYGLQRRPNAKNHPQFFAWFIRHYVYEPLADSKGAILEMLDESNPIVYMSGGRRYKMFSFLSDEIGLPAFRAHLWQVVGIGGAVTTKAQFERGFKNAFPAAKGQLEFTMPDDLKL
jgi:hypothetical protein